MTRTVRVFVYGTLLPGESNHGVASPWLVDARPGEVNGRLVDCGLWPALVRSGDAAAGRVRGMWFTVCIEALRVMDELEDFIGPESLNGYERIWIRDASGQPLEGWVYVWPDARGLPYMGVDYWPDRSKAR
ncbi:MAG: gamma-glutamylcyclotransferase [Thermobacillus sp. ZCTH02-B1]|uniref:gamma-glutamylcyclotransferase family protein n=1 Tax=Thermobacillus sp. ZCTH02-B1 TaxID=1858795 RepID=UPI000B54CDB4|nr:gamma-glutamylcyclotransferase family protein [Thermobacillus sp. ZCTH02-B1]OUM95366.1 MAG: gamma-glutamylcyclotransferase [Thermobacillus sp. ZCTH02-B1]